MGLKPTESQAKTRPSNLCPISDAPRRSSTVTSLYSQGQRLIERHSNSNGLRRRMGSRRPISILSPFPSTGIRIIHGTLPPLLCERSRSCTVLGILAAEAFTHEGSLQIWIYRRDPRMESQCAGVHKFSITKLRRTRAWLEQHELSRIRLSQPFFNPLL